MRKKIFITFAFIVGFILSGCQSTSSNSLQTSTNAPVFSGIREEAEIHLGETYDALTGVKAIDEEDGDLTSEIILTSVPALVNNDGILFPDSQGEYYLTYSVTDSDELTTEAYATLTVSAPLPVETLYTDLELGQTRTFVLHDWELASDDSAEAVLNADGDHLEITVTDPGEELNSLLFAKQFDELTLENEYTLEITAASNDVAMQLQVYSAEQIVHTSPVYNLTSAAAVYADSFTLESAEEVVISLAFGGELSEVDSVLTIFSIKLSSETDEDNGEILLLDEFDTSISGWDFNAFDGASAALDYDEALQFTVNNYAPDNKPWNINLYRITDILMKAGAKYRVEIELTSENEQFFELCVEDEMMDWQVRAAFLNGTFSAGENNIDFIFVANQSLDGVYLKLALGEGSAATNEIIITKLQLTELSTVVTNDVFRPEFSTPDWLVFNSDGGEGSASGLSGELVYTITTFGELDWHNKIAFENIELAAFAKYRFEVEIEVTEHIIAQVIINESEKWNPYYNERTTFITGEKATVSFTLDALLYEEKTVDFLLQFGGFSENVTPTTVTISSVKIYAIV